MTDPTDQPKMLKVSDLIAALSRLPPNADVQVHVDEEFHSFAVVHAFNQGTSQLVALDLDGTCLPDDGSGSVPPEKATNLSLALQVMALPYGPDLARDYAAIKHNADRSVVVQVARFGGAAHMSADRKPFFTSADGGIRCSGCGLHEDTCTRRLEHPLWQVIQVSPRLVGHSVPVGRRAEGGVA